MRLAKKKIYGASSEQVKEEFVGQLSLMLDKTRTWLSTGRTTAKKAKVAAHTRQKRSSRVEEDFPEDVPDLGV